MYIWYRDAGYWGGIQNPMVVVLLERCAATEERDEAERAQGLLCTLSRRGWLCSRSRSSMNALLHALLRLLPLCSNICLQLPQTRQQAIQPILKRVCDIISRLQLLQDILDVDVALPVPSGAQGVNDRLEGGTVSRGELGQIDARE